MVKRKLFPELGPAMLYFNGYAIKGVGLAGIISFRRFLRNLVAVRIVLRCKGGGERDVGCQEERDHRL
jgi:hypothetical protein